MFIESRQTLFKWKDDDNIVKMDDQKLFPDEIIKAIESRDEIRDAIDALNLKLRELKPSMREYKKIQLHIRLKKRILFS